VGQGFAPGAIDPDRLTCSRSNADPSRRDGADGNPQPQGPRFELRAWVSIPSSWRCDPNVSANVCNGSKAELARWWWEWIERARDAA